MSEWLKRTGAEQITIYTRDSRVHRFADVPEGATVVLRPLRQGHSAADEAMRLATSPRDGRKLAAEIDAGGHDVAFCFASCLTQAIDVLPFLRTPSVFYAPETLRSAYEPASLVQRGSGWRGAITRLGLNPIEIRRRSLDRRYVRSAQNLVTHSRFTRDTLLETYGVDSAVVRLGVDSDTFVPARGVTRDGYVLSVGALHPLKGHQQVIEALATLPAPRPPLVVVGDRGDAAGQLEELARALGVELHLRSEISLADIVSAYQRAGVVACAQIREPFGLVPLEAMACATPVVAVAEGGLRETVVDDMNGLLVERDPGAVGAAIARVLGDDVLARRLGTAGRETVEREWKWEQTASGFDRLLTEVSST